MRKLFAVLLIAILLSMSSVCCAENAEVVLSGSGTQILDAIDLTLVPCRVVVTGDIELTLSRADGDVLVNGVNGDKGCAVLSSAGSYQPLVEGKGDWEISITPILNGGDVTLSGVGPCVTDFFDISAPQIVSVHVDMSESAGPQVSYLAIMLYGERYQKGVWQSVDLAANQVVRLDTVIDNDMILKPVDGCHQYCWVVCADPGVAWSITAK